MDWTSPGDIREQVERYWARGRLLTVGMDGESLFPLSLKLRRPDARALADQFDEVRRWVRVLEEGSKPRVGFGYQIHWEERAHRQTGKNQIPASLSVPTRQDALQLIGKRRQADRFDELADATLRTFPALQPWLAKRPLKLLEALAEWERILAVLVRFRDYPRPGVFLRQLDIPGVDTKFVETHRGVLSELLDEVLPADTVDRSARTFEARYGLLAKPVLIRFRILDERRRIGGLSDIATPAAQFAELAPRVERVFITENDTNGLAFPDLADSLVIFGLGYGLERLAEVAWLREKAIYYWGDIDTHGFAMLDRVRGSFPNARSVMMDRETLLAHRELWVREEAPYTTPALARLTSLEQALFDDLVQDRLGEHIRLEQERISFRCLTEALERVSGEDPR